MKKMIALFVVIFVIALPLIALKAKRDVQEAMERPNVSVRVSESAARYGEQARVIRRAESEHLPRYSTSECIAALNASYKQMWEREHTLNASAPPRYAISDSERREIERIVASEGGYCEYRFQALVAECILNGCEAEDMRPLELFERGDFWITHNVEPTEVTKQAVSDVFDRGIMPTTDKVRYYYNPKYCESAMHESFCYVLTCCDCRFFKDWE